MGSAVGLLAALALGSGVGCGRIGFSDGGRATDATEEGLAPVTTGHGFPRIGALSIADSHDYTQEPFRAIAARHHVVVLAYYPEWQAGFPAMPLADVVDDVKARSAVDTRMFVYVNNFDQLYRATLPGDGSYPLIDALNTNGWWLNTEGPGGAIVDGYASADFGQVNTSTFPPATPSGATWASTVAAFHHRYVIEGDAMHAAVAGLDGFYIGNVHARVIVEGDWDRDGVDDAGAEYRTELQQGGARIAAELAARWPAGITLAGQLAWDGDVSGLAGVFQGGSLGPLLGTSSTTEERVGFDRMMEAYRRSLDVTAAPRYVLFMQTGWREGDHAAMRYGLGAALMDDGYFAIDNGLNSLVDAPLWFDEFDADLGQAVQPRQTAAWASGMWRRDFERGIALVNPRTNTAQTVELGGTFQKLSGTQDPATNDGALVTSVTLAPGDGLILRR